MAAEGEDVVRIKRKRKAKNRDSEPKAPDSGNFRGN